MQSTNASYVLLLASCSNIRPGGMLEMRNDGEKY